ncbi:MAG: AAA family ATPase [Ruminococcus sp.]|nr:AAA family ATPase [Ruminococcus sp.]
MKKEMKIIGNELTIYNSEYIMTTPLEKQDYIIYKMMYPGLYILAGAPKIGKSWLALDLCMSVAAGEQFLMLDTNIGQVLYLSLEDNLLRLQNRIYELTEEPCENLNFAIEAQSIGNGLEEELENSKQKLPNLKVIVIDTLQKVRCSTDINYGSDYKELSTLKLLADKLKVAILVVHHTRKCYDSDPFNMVSGSTGIIGSVDGIMVMIEEKRGSGKAKLYCAGRDIEHLELNLEFFNHRWNVVDDVPERKPDLFSFAIHDFMVEERRFTGSATELCKMMYKRFGQEYAPNWITRDLVQHTEELKIYGVRFSMRRSHGSRILDLVYDEAGDSKNGSLLWVEISDHAGTRSSGNIYLPLFEAGDGKKAGDGICGSG